MKHLSMVGVYFNSYIVVAVVVFLLLIIGVVVLVNHLFNRSEANKDTKK